MFRIFVVVFGALVVASTGRSEADVIVTCVSKTEKFEISDRDYSYGFEDMKITDSHGHVRYDGQAHINHTSARDTQFWSWFSLDGKFQLEIVTMFGVPPKGTIEETYPADMQCVWRQ